jgi:hypothetical protein
VDLLLFPNDGPRADRITPELQNIQVGERILDGPPEAETGFTVEALSPERYLVRRSTKHLPPGWAKRFGAQINFTWTFVLDDVNGTCTRFIFRSRSEVTPLWVAAIYVAQLVPADFVMSRQMLRGVAAHVERRATVKAATTIGATEALPRDRRGRPRPEISSTPFWGRLRSPGRPAGVVERRDKKT